MIFRGWPKAVGGDRFHLATLDPSAPPAEFKVTTWSSVFGAGGNVSIEAFDAEKKRFSSSFGSIKIEQDGPVVDERAHLQELLDDFTTNLESNWRLLIEDARASVAAFYAKQAAEYAEKAANAAKGIFK